MSFAEPVLNPAAQTNTSRIARIRSYLMCPPAFFGVSYSINPWMDVTQPVDRALAMAQWQRLRRVFVELGHEVNIIDAVDGLPDMVFTANGATVLGGRVLLAKFRHVERAAEADLHRDWFSRQGFDEIHEPLWVNEGEGDYLFAGRWLLAGTGFRTARRSHREAGRFFGRPVVSLRLVDERFYHLDTALAVLDDDLVMYFPPAFSATSQRVLRRLFPDAILANDSDAEAFGLNAVSDGRHVILPQGATELVAQLRERGFAPIGVDMSELHKAGGAVKCCTLELN